MSCSCVSASVLTTSGSKGDNVVIKAHGGTIDIEGVVVAVVNEKLQMQKIDVFFDPQGIFRQMLRSE